MTWSNRAGLALAGVACLCCVRSAAAQTAIGTATSVVPAATNARASVVRDLSINDALDQNDRIRTTGQGAVRVRFADDTLLTRAIFV